MLELSEKRPDYADLEGKIAVVTGGSRGIGAATARMLAEQGVRVAVVGRDADALGAIAAEINTAGGDAQPFLADCRHEPELAQLREDVQRRFGRVQIVAAFAGGGGQPVPTVSETVLHWRDVLESNLTSTFLTVAAFLPAMIEDAGGSIVTMSSAAAREPTGASAAYAAAKGGVIAFSSHLAAEVAGAGVRVNCVAPAAIETERMRSSASPEQRAALAGSFPLGRLGQTVDVAHATCFLASQASAWITGVTLDVAGGKVMR
jgi:3-oxoacyl-[acyl-carrier protein] reductase